MSESTRALVAAYRQELEENFAAFVREAWKQVQSEELIWGWHLDALCEHLQAVLIPHLIYDEEGNPVTADDGEQKSDTIRRLLVNVPPGTMKSTIISIMFHPWVWTFKPDHKFMSTSHNLELSTEHALTSRRIIESEWYQALWPLPLRDDQNSKTNYANEQGGFRKAAAFSGLTGKRANCLLIDDPHSHKSANSDAERAADLAQFRFSSKSRINNPTKDAVIVIMQRFHEDDISGFILENPEKNNPYTHVCLPMEYEGDKRHTRIGWQDPRTVEGQLLIPAHMSREYIDDLKSNGGLGLNEYAGQFQQRPVPKEAGILDVNWFKRFRMEDFRNQFQRGVEEDGTGRWSGVNFYMTSDHAPAGSNDFNVFQIWGVDTKRNCWLVEMFYQRCKMNVALGLRKREDGKYELGGMGALPMIRRWNPVKYFPEKDGTWHSVEDFFQQALRETGTHVVIDPESPHGIGNNKIVKAGPFAALASLGQIYIPEGKMGDDALDQYGRFPNARHDDIVDASSMIGRVFKRIHNGHVVRTQSERDMGIEDYLPHSSASTSGSDDYFFL